VCDYIIQDQGLVIENHTFEKLNYMFISVTALSLFSDLRIYTSTLYVFEYHATLLVGQLDIMLVEAFVFCVTTLDTRYLKHLLTTKERNIEL